MQGDKIRILVVCNWPLGGIRTYLKYLYNRLPSSKFQVTFLLGHPEEKAAIVDDFSDSEIVVKWAPKVMGKPVLALGVLKELASGKYDLIHSQGFISAVHVWIPHLFFRKPSILTIHGILEPKYFGGSLGWLKKIILRWTLMDLNVIHGVGANILKAVREQLPYLDRFKGEFVVIQNCIDTSRFLEEFPDARRSLESQMEITPETFVFGFFGRYMPEKGFDLILKACKLSGTDLNGRQFIILAVGSGDYEREYKRFVKTHGLESVVRFIPFVGDIRPLLQGCNAVIMPSNWEAYPILSAEVLCSGIPLICTNCGGLAEATKDTPTIMVEVGDSEGLLQQMEYLSANSDHSRPFSEYRNTACERFDISQAVEAMELLFTGLADK